MFVDFRNVKSLNIGGKNVKILRINNRQIWSAVKPSYTGLKLQAEQDNVQVGLFAQGAAPDISIQYSMDEGQTWSDYTIGEYIDLPTMGDAVCWRSGSSVDQVLGTSATKYHYFKMTGKVAAYGSVVSLLRQDFETNTDMTGTYCLTYLFKSCTSLTKAPNLPSTKLTQRCYAYMFNGCSSLTQAPELPATTLIAGCYQRMFSGCTALTQAPDLPALTAVSYCYNSMFLGCTALTQAPDLPATINTDATWCYNYMFGNCTSLTQAPDLPSTTLAAYCYQSMFYGCTSLTQAPELPATTLTPNCYTSMFNGCTSLNHVKLGYTGSFEMGYFDSWLNNVAEHGNLEYDGDDVVLGPSAIPVGWTINGQQAPEWNCLKFTAVEANSTVMVSKQLYAPYVSLQYSSNGVYWTAMIVGSTKVTLPNVGDYIYVKATSTNSAMASNMSSLNYFTMTGKISASGNVVSLLDGMRFDDVIQLPDFAFAYLFQNCTALTTAPEITASGSVGTHGCSYMYSGCSALTTPPSILPMMTLGDRCYTSMFENCTSLTTAPVLPATTVTSYAYQYMFKGCTSLTTAPVLPATTLSTYAYYYMFNGCTGLVIGPDIMATSFDSDYSTDNMMRGCTRLSEIRMATTGKFAGGFNFRNWVSGVPSTGNFFYSGPDTTRGANGIPSGWTVLPYESRSA